MSKEAAKITKRTRRHNRIRAKVEGTSECPRLAVYRSNRYLYAQLIDDEKGVTLASADSRTAKGTTSRERARAVGTAIAEKAAALKVEAVVFDRGGFLYAGSIKQLAEGAREGGLTF